MMNKEIYVVVGHRGTGKTTWVQNLKNNFLKDSCQIFDIDQEIARTTNQTISQLFEIGENHFRKIESEVFQSCIQKSQSLKTFIVLGAGYQGDIPKNCKVIHLGRPSDSEGRVFFNRPRLLSNLSHLDEYQSLYKKRQTYYKKVRDVVWTRLDYFDSLQEWDQVFFGKPLPFQNGVLTLNDSNFSSNHFDYFLNQKLKWNLKYIELKDSEVSEGFLYKVTQKIPLEKILFSFRDKKSELFKNFLNQKVKDDKSVTIDWPLEWGELGITFLKESCSLIYSLHDRDLYGSFQKTLDTFSGIKDAHLKLAIEVNSFEELWQGHLWRMKDPSNRSFHPRSGDGRWKWYRVLFGSQQHLYFIKEDSASGVLDQPFVAESVQYFKSSFKNFACVLGNPIEHSATPYEHHSFFSKYHMPVVKILMKEEEVHQSYLKILEDLGMSFAAVTSPLKKKFFSIFENLKYKTHSDISALNTLILTSKGWQGFNTDLEGARSLVETVNSKGIENFMKKVSEDLIPSKSQKSFSYKNWNDRSIAVWGGGGTRDVLKSVFQENPNVSFYSGRTGQLLSGNGNNPDTIIWAIGRARMKDCVYPSWKPALVLDLNYTEDSPGREYALRTKAQYVSGWMWFKEQAKSQRELFKKLFQS